MSDRTQTISVEPMTREEIEAALEGLPRPAVTEAEASATVKLRAALSQPEHQGDKRILPQDRRRLDKWFGLLQRGELVRLDSLDFAAIRHIREAFSASQPPAPVLSDREREKLRMLADRIASDIEDDWPHAEEMRGHIRLLRNLADQQEEAK